MDPEMVDTITKIADNAESKSPTWFLIIVTVLFVASLVIAIKWFANEIKNQRASHKEELLQMSTEHKNSLIEAKNEQKEVTHKFMDQLKIDGVRLEGVINHNTVAFEKMDKRLEALEFHSQKSNEILESICKTLKLEA